ncbi:regulatory protein, luxR family [Streptomyces zhaozhouensis]|uniref:Regulatory protein, luxR family n=2 Tax=Streptomyces zhaozhouensis TaxID=1300267 RepID=A0A286E7H3_9ACTN|nr:regulatory protein, luxR family [Streptomyces zhaozhouensis]
MDMLTQLAKEFEGVEQRPATSWPLAPWPDLENDGKQIAEDIARFSRQVPVLVVVDDLHHSNAESLAGILHLVRLARTAPVMVLLVVPDRSHLIIPLFCAELMREPHYFQLRLGPLSRDGVLEVVARELGAEAAERMADDCYRISGGNPLVLRTLIEEWRSNSSSQGEPVPPEAMRLEAGRVSALAVFASLHRSGPETMAVARGVALLGTEVTVDLLAQLLKTDPESVADQLRSLQDAGILQDVRFRHPRAAETLLGDPDFDELEARHYQVATILESEGYSSSLVARHLVASGTTSAPWTNSVLRESAMEAVGQGDWSFAVKCLALAMRGPLDDAEKGRVITKLIWAQWQLNPARVIRYLDQCYALQRVGKVPDEDIVTLLTIFLWHGRIEQAAAMLVDVAMRADTSERRAELRAFLGWALISYPVLRARLEEADTSLLDRLAEVDDPALLRHLRALRGAFSEHGPSDVAALSESIGTDQVSRGDAIATVLQALVCVDELDRAERCATRVVTEAGGPGTDSLRGVPQAIRAETMRRRGDLITAERYATTALKHLAPRAWGVTLGLPLSVLVAAHTARGELDQAEEYLSWIVPQNMFETLHGVAYLHARARYRLAGGQYQAAHRDFLRCGELLTAWEMDIPSLAPWRLGIAEVALAQGDRAEARRLVEKQLRQPRAQHPRIRGAALRVYAQVGDRHRRLAVLTEAAELLADGSDLHQRFLVLVDLSLAHQDVGDSQSARSVGELAWRSAVRCGAERVARRLLPESSTVGAPEPAALPAWSGWEAAQLSEAEQRVAQLAAAGDTNREISRKLFITISTVEQHLTRVYRKLQLAGRADLQRVHAGNGGVRAATG